jgi:hypothetical protein
MRKSHIAIAGILVSVLGFANTAWADTATVIASQAYVDAKVGTKLNASALNAGTLSATSTTTVPSEKTVNDAITSAVAGIDTSAPAATTYVTNGTNALSITTTGTNGQTHAPSIDAVKGMKTTSVRASGAVDTLVPTEKAVATALTDKINSVANTSTNAIIATENKFAANPAIQKGVLYIKGNTLANHSDAADLSTITAEQSWTTADGTDNSIKTIRENKKMDDYVPTMAAVEARVKAAEKQIPTNLRALATLDAVGSAQITDGSIAAAYLASDSVITAKIKNLNVTTDKLAADAVTTAKIKNLNVTTDKLAADAVTTAKIKNLNVTTDKLAADAVTNAKLADNAVQTENIKDGTIVNADISNSANIAYSKMDATLKDVNSASTNATCTAASPCVLTYYKTSSGVYYKWTNLIETDGVTALPNS